MNSFSKRLTLLLFGLLPMAAQADDFSGTATATVVDQISLTPSSQLSFGSFAVGGTGGTIKSDGTHSSDINVISSGNNAIFMLHGKANNSANVVGDSTVTLTGPSGTPNMSAALTFPASVSFDPSGDTSLYVSGELTVAANQPAGTYTGTYNFSINY